MSDQLPLFASMPDDEQPDVLAGARITYRPAGSALTKATGFMSAYDFTFNPYVGCAFGCTYCYAASFTRTNEQADTWGRWVEVKDNVVQKLKRMRTDLRGRTVYMSSVTDPYQAIERRLGLVREALAVLAGRGVRLVIQTRSPLVTRDIDVLQRFEHVRVNMTITTDSERVRKTFEPRCPSNRQRLAAIAEVSSAGIPSSITLTPLLPVENVGSFAESLAATGVRDFVVQPFHAERGRFVAGTREPAIRLIKEMGWDADAYHRTVENLRRALPSVVEGREGFRPQ